MYERSQNVATLSFCFCLIFSRNILGEHWSKLKCPILGSPEVHDNKTTSGDTEAYKEKGIV